MIRLVPAALCAGLLAAPPGLASELAGRIDAFVRPFADAGHFSGCVLAAEGDEVLYEGCFGLANAEHGVPNDADTRFGIASVTKGIQLVLLARLVDAGRLELGDPIAKWLPGFPRGDSLAVLDLSNHTAGVPHRLTEPGDELLPQTPAAMVERAIEIGLLEDAIGTRTYSSGGYSVLARVLELAGEAPWEELMEREVFAPVGMTGTVHPSGGRLVPQRAEGYRWTPQGIRRVPMRDLSYLVGAGSLFSTPRDLLAHTRAIVNDTYGETARSYRLGAKGMSSNGTTAGYRSFVDYDLATDRTIVVCANLYTGAVNRLREALPALMAGEDVAAPAIPDITAADVPADALRELSGRYQLRPGSVLDVRPRDGMLFANDWMLVPRETDRFFSIQDYAELTFLRDDAGRPRAIDWGGFEVLRVGDLER